MLLNLNVNKSELSSIISTNMVTVFVDKASTLFYASSFRE